MRDHDPRLPFGDGGGHKVASLGASWGVVGGQVAGDLGEADGDEELGEPAASPKVRGITNPPAAAGRMPSGVA